MGGGADANQKLAMATLGTLSVVSTLALRGGDKGDKVPPIQASSGDEERFIKYHPPPPLLSVLPATGMRG